MTDDEVAAQVRADAIDILVDLSGAYREPPSRGVFARKPRAASAVVARLSLHHRLGRRSTIG
ncbi:MAG: hypothetical protein WDO24_27475 [Pseudomonadota bacterium]